MTKTTFNKTSTQIKYNDFPFDSVVEQVSDAIQNGAVCFQKFTCSHCNSRQTMDVPNTLYKSGRCEECQKVTEIKNCNFLAIFSGSK